MPSLSCFCPEIIEKEGLAYFLREYLSGVAVTCYREGMTVDHLSKMLLQFLLEAMTSDELPSEYHLDREPNETELYVISSVIHMVNESRLAGYNALAFHASLKDALKGR